ncbi:MAG: HD-GYP domain-containing protein [Negativicutes bacterium]|nr:HD-GYP domain-containing protein [Negativicutes bacterium]
MALLFSSGVDELEPGMALARDVILEDGRVLFGKDTILTDKKIRLLQAWDIADVLIVCSEAGSSQHGRADRLANFLDQYSLITQALTEAFEKAQTIKKISLRQMESLAEKTMDVINDDSGIIGYLTQIRSADDYTFKHCVNVGILAGVFCKCLGYTGLRLREIIMTGFLHDIGKTQIPTEILNKPGKLTVQEMMIIQQHPALGLKLLTAGGQLAKSVVLGVAQHHERADGTGYPCGLTSSQTAISARIIAICDVYDAMTSSRAYRAAQTPFQAIEELSLCRFNQLDPELCNQFIDRATGSLIGSTVRLSDGREAKIVALSGSSAVRPIVQVTQTECVNLAERNDLTIVDVVAV